MPEATIRKFRIVQTEGSRQVQRLVKMPNHPKAHRGFVRDYIIKAEKALSKPLPNKAAVHHHTPEQLVICQNHAYHKLLHRRADAFYACGHASWRKCYICKKYDDPINGNYILNSLKDINDRLL